MPSRQSKQRWRVACSIWPPASGISSTEEMLRALLSEIALQVTLQTLLYTQDQQELWAAQQLLRTFCLANQLGCSKLLGTVKVADIRPGPGGPAGRTFGNMLLTALLATGGHSLQVSRTTASMESLWLLRTRMCTSLLPVLASHKVHSKKLLVSLSIICCP